MSIQLSEDQELIRNMAREFAEKELMPIAAEIDRTHEFHEASFKAMGEQGFFGLSMPEEYDGGGDYLSFITCVEELSRGSSAHANALSVHISVNCSSILNFGSDYLKEKYLPPMCRGEMYSAFALTEPNAGSDASALLATAVRDGDNYILNGTKCFITMGGKAGVYIVIAMTDKSKGVKGLSAFVVEPSFPGFKVGQFEDKMGQCGIPTSEIIFTNCVVPRENLLGEEGMGFKVAMKGLDSGRVSIGAQAVGLAQAALEAAVTYSKQRVAFGKPISANQGLQWMLADMAVDIEASRLLVQNAAMKKQLGLPYGKEAAMAKLFASEAVMRITTKAVQIHGGIGYTKSYPVERYMREAKIHEIYEGTSEIQRIVISRAVLS